MNPFETETMADLYLRQGKRAQALEIYQRLRARATDAAARERISRRVEAIEREGAAPAATPAAPTSSPGPSGAPTPGPEKTEPLPSPGVRAQAVGDRLTVDWRLPAGTVAPTLQILLLTHAPAGVVSETRSLPLAADAGRLVLEVAGLRAARAAAGFRSDGRFVPLARS